MHGRMDRPLHDWHHVRRYFRCSSRRQLASTSDADSRNRLRSRYGSYAILYHATFIWTRICCIKNTESYTGKTSQFDESYCFWRGSLSIRIVSQLVVRGICLTRRVLHRIHHLSHPKSSIHRCSLKFKMRIFVHIYRRKHELNPKRAENCGKCCNCFIRTNDHSITFTCLWDPTGHNNLGRRGACFDNELENCQPGIRSAPIILYLCHPPPCGTC